MTSQFIISWIEAVYLDSHAHCILHSINDQNINQAKKQQQSEFMMSEISELSSLKG